MHLRVQEMCINCKHTLQFEYLVVFECLGFELLSCVVFLTFYTGTSLVSTRDCEIKKSNTVLVHVFQRLEYY